MDKKSICSDCCKQDVCNRKCVVQGYEEELMRLSRKILVLNEGIQVDNSLLAPNHYQLENMGIFAKVECNRKMPSASDYE